MAELAEFAPAKIGKKLYRKILLIAQEIPDFCAAREQLMKKSWPGTQRAALLYEQEKWPMPSQ